MGQKRQAKKSKIIQEKSHGGLGMVDVMSLFDSFKASWIYRIKKADPERDNWVQISNCIISQLGGLDVLQEFNFEKCSEMPELEKLPIFYKDVFTAYSRAYLTDLEVFQNTILHQPIWGNRFISIRKNGKKSVLLLQNWIRSGIRYARDLIFVDGYISV